MNNNDHISKLEEVKGNISLEEFGTFLMLGMLPIEALLDIYSSSKELKLVVLIAIGCVALILFARAWGALGKTIKYRLLANRAEVSYTIAAKLYATFLVAGIGLIMRAVIISVTSEQAGSALPWVVAYAGAFLLVPAFVEARNKKRITG